MADKKKYFRRSGKFRIKRILSPAFLVVLLISFSMWFLTKLSHDYTAEIPVRVEIDGTRFKVVCTARGSGYRLMSHRMFRVSKLSVNPKDIAMTPSDDPGYFVISPASLLQAIDKAESDVEIVSVREIPEIRFNDAQE